jgi:3-deoxy-D-manno-octulosonate 8-phosphate phosphatase (KDO 8-P phosphatase)
MRVGLELAIVSGRNSAATDTRMKDLGIQHVLQGKKDKVAHLQPLLTSLGLEFSDIAFVGNEILDIGLAKKAGLSIAVADSAKELIKVVDYVTLKNGGFGAVREVIEAYFEATNQDPLDMIP